MSNNKIPQYDNATVEKLASHIKSIIEILGEDPTREGLVKTPQRAAKALIDNTSGYNQDPAYMGNGHIYYHRLCSCLVYCKEIFKACRRADPQG